MSYRYLPHKTNFDDKDTAKLEDLEFLAKKSMLNYTSSYRFREHFSLRKAYPMISTFQSLEFDKKVKCRKYLKELFTLTLPLLMDFEFVDPPVGSAVKVNVYHKDDKLSKRVPIGKAKLEAKMTMSKTNYFRSAVNSKGGKLIRVIHKPTTDEDGNALIPDLPKEGDLDIKLKATADGYESVTITLRRRKKDDWNNWIVDYNTPSNRII